MVCDYELVREIKSFLVNSFEKGQIWLKIKQKIQISENLAKNGTKSWKCMEHNGVMFGPRIRSKRSQIQGQRC